MEKYRDFPNKVDPDTENLEILLPQEHINYSPKRICLFRVYLFAIGILALTGVTVLVTTTIYKYPPSSLSSPSLYTTSLRTIPPIELQQTQSAYGAQCGNSPVEAHRLGCRFDMINFSWQHADCWDETLYAQFLARYKNTWYWETLDGEPVPVDEVLAGLHQVLNTTWDFYIVHCLYAMERVAQGSSRLPRAVRQRHLLDDWSPPYLHAKQCMLDLMDTGKHAGKTIMTSTKMWYPACEPRLVN
ncbi:hypothetical protein EMCG_02356 [[Emmonsia] crescens]|uniref:Uncharacterized protein n=1 Tax=[Emmonsia] crescens TaxID=73230 RepID=A0A0G2HZT1_9EURO|nr:hypothetical protein EMCG_02356 [Emmonsia crescens UAMH 3008]